MARTTADPSTKKTASSARGSPRTSNREVGSPTHAEGSSLPPLRRTELPGVYLNRDGAQVDEHGVLLSLRRVKAIEADHVAVVTEQPTIESPAQFLLTVVRDVTLPMSTRIGAAVSAAPYFDRKMPLALEGGDPGRPIKSESSVALGHLQKLPLAERKAAIALLEKIGLIPSES